MVVWNTKKLISKLIEGNISSKEELIYYLIPFIPIGLGVIFKSPAESHYVTSDVYNFFLRVVVVLFAFFLHKRFSNDNFLKSLFSLACLATIKSIVFIWGGSILIILLGAGLSLFFSDIRYSEYVTLVLPYRGVVGFHLVSLLTIRYFLLLHKQAKKPSIEHGS